MSDDKILRAVLPNFLPGKLEFAPGTIADYRKLEGFHYIAGRPSTFAAIQSVRYTAEAAPPVLVAVAVLSWPTACHRVRFRHFNLLDRSFGERLRWANENLRTISRVIVHPQFRGLGLASALVRRVCNDCTTPFVEATARMGRVHPFFAHGGMTEIEVGPNESAYYVWQKKGMSA